MSLTQNLEEPRHISELLKLAKKFRAGGIPAFLLNRLATYERDPNYFSEAIARLKEKKETKVADQDF